MSRADDIEIIRTTGLPSAERRHLERAVLRGQLVRIRPGVLVQQGALDDLLPEHRHHVLVRASIHRARPSDLVSHESACAVLGLPFVGPWPPKVHVCDPTSPNTRVTAWFVRHGSEHRPPLGRIRADEIAATDAARTAVDLAASRPLIHSLPVIDHVLGRGLATTTELEREAGSLRKGRTKAAVAIGMGSGLSGSPAESVCRVRFRQLGVPQPVQQHTFRRPGERTAIVDFWFPEAGVVVEVDGRGKYEDPAMLGGSTTADAHWQEKQREDFVRSFPEVRAVVRLTWADLMDPERVRAKLRRAGITCR